MRSYSLFTIVLLCVAIVVVDVLTFYWLQSITHLIVSTNVKIAVFVLFWTFTIGLVTAILALKIRIETIPVTKRQTLISSLYGLTASSFIPKILFSIVVSILILPIMFFPIRS